MFPPLFQIREKQGGVIIQTLQIPKFSACGGLENTSFRCSKSAAGDFFLKRGFENEFLRSENAFLKGFQAKTHAKSPKISGLRPAGLDYYPPLFQIREKQGGGGLNDMG